VVDVTSHINLILSLCFCKILVYVESSFNFWCLVLSQVVVLSFDAEDVRISSFFLFLVIYLIPTCV